MSGSSVLLTPGPLTTALSTRQAMLRDWGSRDSDFIALTAELRAKLLALAHGQDAHTAILLQGSGTFIVEAAIGTLIGPQDKLLVLANGAYGERMATIANRLGKSFAVLHWPENTAVDCDALAAYLDNDTAITHVAVVHCETTTGLLNPLDKVARVTAENGRQLIVDAMSSFGALPIDLRAIQAVAILASSNKCLEGAPGIGIAIVAREKIEKPKGNSASLSLDLHEQWRGLETNGQWRFTPPVQVAAALREALLLLEAEGGPPARLARYRNNFAVLTNGMTQLGFSLYLEEAVQAPIIATFRYPTLHFDFKAFYDALVERGFVIYPGKLTREETFRIGCIGALHPDTFERLIETIRKILNPV